METQNCSNYIFCKNELSFEHEYGKHMCIDCELIFGKWKGGRGKAVIKDNTNCTICLKIKLCISQPKCDHFACFECFRLCQYGDDTYDIENKPKFPYDKDIEKQYYDVLETPDLEIDAIEEIRSEWETKYPLIKQYNIKNNEWEDKKFEKSLDDENLQLCIVCGQ